ncbi:MAG: VOC family protein [Chloroflexota bacterium]|nr:MAG: VOC family protein [Chloroflexota bacterium]
MAENSQSSIPPVTPYLAVKDAARAIEFYRRAFGAVEAMRLEENGKISHAEIRINGAPIYISDEWPEHEALSPESVGGSPVMIVLDVPDVAALFQQAVAAGAAVSRPLQEGFDGDLRTAKVNDPFGHRWMITTREDAQAIETSETRGKR